MTGTLFVAFLARAIKFATVFMFGSTGETITEKSGHYWDSFRSSWFFFIFFWFEHDAVIDKEFRGDDHEEEHSCDNRGEIRLVHTDITCRIRATTFEDGDEETI